MTAPSLPRVAVYRVYAQQISEGRWFLTYEPSGSIHTSTLVVS